MVSIILPNLNTPINVLKSRLNSIVYQSYQDWECIVIDGFSTNGSWQIITEFTPDNRFSYHQLPPKGVYDAWNEGIKRSNGEYIYIATSDDICEPDFLTKMTAALNAHPDCDIAHCCLKIIDKYDNLYKSQWNDWAKVKFYGNLIHRPHKRPPGYDAIVHFGWSTVYTSIVQLLLRRSLFNKVGLFATQYGGAGDFEWGLRASTISGTVHVPEYLASWRKHSLQTTNDEFFDNYKFYAELIRMSEDSIKKIKQLTGNTTNITKRLFLFYLFQCINLAPASKKIAIITRYLFRYPYLTSKVIIYKATKRVVEPDAFLREQLELKNVTISPI